MELIVTEDYAALSRAGADYICDLVAANPAAAIVVATGNTPMGAYRELAARYAAGALDTSRLRVFQLDAYMGLAATDRRSLFRWMDEAFLTPLGIRPEQVVRLPGDAPDPDAACRAYDDAVAAAGGFDGAILGLGPNGHLGFNEPPAEPSLPTRVVTLSEESLASNAAYWGAAQDVPRHALTCGMAQLLAARHTLLLVSGAHKRSILRRATAGPITPDVPASFLQRSAGVAVIADRAAWPEREG